MRDNHTIKSGNVVLVDPNSVNINTNQINSIPQYENMHINADLIAKRRGRTILFTGGASTDKSITVNLMGFNQNESSSNYGNFTTNYYDGSTGNDKQYESFGIQSIKTSINSSFIPQVEIQFVDIRGLSFFNQDADKETSPYRILFDFPPPIFELTVKGYYGKALRYKLHLVNYTSEFNSDNGNFVINANFVAITFAPLADILFRYIVNFPLITSEEFDPNPGLPPNNTYELVLKTKKLITATEDFKKSNVENQKYDEVIERISKINQVLTFLSGSLQSSKLADVGNTPIFFIRNKSENSETSDINGKNNGSLTQINSLNEYNELIIRKRVVGAPVNMEERVFIGFPIGETSINAQYPIYDNNRINNFKSALNNLKLELINKAKADIGGGNIYDTQLKNADILESRYNLNEFLEDKIARFVVLDLTDFYLYVYKLSVTLNNEKTDLINLINTSINNLVLENLGMLPTIYNIFEIILNDVDEFFYILRTTSYNAFIHHNGSDEIKQLIVGGNLRDIGMKPDEDIYSFPLVIKNKSECGRLIEERIAPIELSNSLVDTFGPFPELELVNDFINTFRRQSNLAKQYNMLDEQNADGSYLWIPISPFDSKLATSNITTPYIGVDSSAGGAESRPIPLNEDNRLNTILNILLDRFYVLSQYVIPEIFISSNEEDIELVTMHANAEAVNLSVSIFNENLRDNIKTFVDTYERAPIQFNNYLANNLPERYNSVGENNRYINIRRPIYVNKNDSNYVGCKIITKKLDLSEVVIGDSEKPVDIFRKEIKGEGIVNAINRFFFGKPNIEYIGYIQENLFHIRDGVSENGRNAEQETILESRFCLPVNSFFNSVNSETVTIGINSDRITINKKTWIDKIKSFSDNRYGGNEILGNRITEQKDAKKLKIFGNIIDVWSKSLAYNDNGLKIYEKIFNISGSQFRSRLSSILLLSNFGYTTSPFNEIIANISKYIFTVPATVNVPSFLPLYIGSLVDIEVDGDLFNEIYDFFINGDGNTLQSGGLTIIADILDVIQKLSPEEKKNFKVLYDRWYVNGSTSLEYGYGRLVTNMYNLINEYSQSEDDSYNDKEEKYSDLLRINGDYYSNTIGRLSRDNYILNFSELTFKYNDLSNEEYVPLSNFIPQTSASSVRFFSEFFKRLKKEINKINENDKEEKEKFKKLNVDEDIITQTYYSLKNINDKWLVEPTENTASGYPFNGAGNNKLINLFSFVDRGMNPVGDTIINPEALISLIEDNDASVLTVLSTLLSNNGFEFFPLQNFMLIDYDESEDKDDWTKSFKIDSSGKVNNSPYFICMYIGGSSRMVTGIDKYGNFQNDGIVDLLNPGTGHFSSPDVCSPLPDRDRQIESNPNFPWGEVRAFRVRFGEQNQSMFKDMRIDSKEFPETNESIQILSRLAGDNRANAPIPKGQNLYNLYENRAYSATITGLGNAMIQPTQYFQLENVPLYNGAYLILNVEHLIESNKMITTFSGTKILKYPIPRVTNAAAILGFDGADAETTNAGSVSENNVILGAGTAGNPSEAKYNSMYTQQIKQNE